MTCMTFLCMIALRTKTVTNTFLSLLDDANGCLCQERLLKSRRNFVLWKRNVTLLSIPMATTLPALKNTY